MNSTNFRTATPTQNHRFFFCKTSLLFCNSRENIWKSSTQMFFKYLSGLVRPLHLIPNQKNHWWKRSSFAQHLPPRSRLAIWSIRQRPGRFSISIDPWSMWFLSLPKQIYQHTLLSIYMSSFLLRPFLPNSPNWLGSFPKQKPHLKGDGFSTIWVTRLVYCQPAAGSSDDTTKL